MVAPNAKREAVARVVAVHGVSRRRACEVLAVDRSSVRYRSSRPEDATARAAMKAVATERLRFGYRRIHIMLERQGIVMNLKKLRRLYGEERLQVRKRGGGKQASPEGLPSHRRPRRYSHVLALTINVSGALTRPGCHCRWSPAILRAIAFGLERVAFNWLHILRP